MAYLLTIHSGGFPAGATRVDGASAVSPATLDVGTLPFEVPSRGVRLEATERPGEVRVTLLPTAGAVSIRCGERVLSAGESVVVPLGRPVSGEGWWLQLCRKRDRAAVSASSKLLGTIAAVGVVLLMAAQLFVSQGLPVVCRNGDFWRRQREVQEIFNYADRVQRRLEKLSCKDSVTAAYVEALLGEMTARRAFLRERALEMRPSLRRSMLDNLKRTEALVLKLEERGKDGLMPPLPELSVDEPVRKIIREQSE